MTVKPAPANRGSIPATEPSRRDGKSLELVRRLDKLFVAVISDSLDKVGLRDNVLHPRVHPLSPTFRVAGYAATVELGLVDQAPAHPEDAYQKEIAAVDSLDHGDVMIVSTCAGSYWGELLATAAAVKGARGVVADAYTRDVRALVEMDFPTFVTAISAQDSQGRTDVVGSGGTIECGGVVVRPGDLVIADQDGIAVIPAEVAEEVISLSEQRVGVEERMRESLADGMSLATAFATYKIL